MGRKPRAAVYEVVVWLPTIMRLVPQHSLRSPSALVADFLVDALRPIGISPPSAGHDAACLQQNFGGCFMPARASQSAHAISRGMGPAAEHLPSLPVAQALCKGHLGASYLGTLPVHPVVPGSRGQ